MNYASKYYQEQIEQRKYEEYLTTDMMKQEFRQFCSTIRFRISDDADKRVRDIYDVLLNQIFAFDPVGWLDAPEVFISTIAAKNGRKQIPWCGIGGLVIFVGLFIRFMMTKTMSDLITAILIGVGLIALVVQFVLLWSSASAKPQQKIHTEQRVSSVKFKAGLQQLAKTLDSHADTLYQAMNETAAITGGTGDADVSLVLDMLKLPSVSQNQEMMDAIDRYLIRNGITKIEYSEEYAHLFLVMPADVTKTITPVLVKDGTILNQGFACKN